MEIVGISQTKRSLRIRVYAGGHQSPQLPYFRCATQYLEEISGRTSEIFSGYEVQYMYVPQVRDLHWSPYDLVTWLLDSDVHFVITHPHQGHPQWNVTHVYDAMNQLKDHTGFPSGNQLRCPIFRQHKYAYLLALCHIVNKTIAVQLPVVETVVDDEGNVRHTSSICGSDFDTPELRNFLNKSNEGEGWVVKHPFVTVHEGMRFCSSHDDVRSCLAVTTANFAGRLPYTMIQPKLLNRKEYKVVVLGGVASHIIPQKANGITCPGRAFASGPEINHFAEMAVRSLAKCCPSSIVDGLVRVDVMVTHCGNLIVNEFESLEAVFEPSEREHAEVWGKLNRFMFQYWRRRIKNIVDAII